MLLFKYVQLAGHDVCHRCQRKIESITDFSIEHRAAWQRAADPKSAFFDLEDIAFSHLRCNVAAGNQSREYPVKHGTNKGYDRGCRCEECKSVKSAKNARRLRGRMVTGYQLPVKQPEGVRVPAPTQFRAGEPGRGGLVSKTDTGGFECLRRCQL